MNNKISRPDVAVIVLTRNAGRLWPEWIKAIRNQTVEAGRYLVVDTSSDDHTVELAKVAGFEVLSVQPCDFNHGGTRQMAVEHCSDADLVIFLTQDALLKQEDSLAGILSWFDKDPQVGLAYGRHVPRPGADLLECHARGFTYPPDESVRDRESFRSMGYRAAFSSDVYAVYRARALRSIGGFPQRIIVSEDSYVAARLLLAGWKSVYAAGSTVEHSHEYSLAQLFRRYFDVGVFHASEQPLMQAVDAPDREAWVYVRSLIRYLGRRRKLLLPLAALQTLVRLIGFRLGKRYRQLPLWLCERISVQKAYWFGEEAHRLSVFTYQEAFATTDVSVSAFTQEGMQRFSFAINSVERKNKKATKNLLQDVDRQKLEY